MITQYFSVIVEQLLPFIFLYTEIHHRFRYIGSRYYKKEPEIIVDIPHRIDPNLDIPILFLVKDAHNFPITLINAHLEILFENKKLTHQIDINLSLNERWWDTTYYIKRPQFSGCIEINTFITYDMGGIVKICKNHNLPIKKSLPLHTYLAEEPYPKSGNIIYGDLHYHTNVTEDMVEFGAPLKPTYIASKALGLDFVCNTDHSYDIDDEIGSWTKTDPNLTKWNNSQRQIKKLNLENEFNNFMIPSEELSLHNLDGYNIHALILNNKAFLPGQGDGGEIPFNFSCDYNTLTLGDVLEDNALCIAAHPCTPVPFLQKLFFKRGEWNFEDLILEHISGLQLFNGEIDNSLFEGLKMWKKLLLSGYKKFIYAGNDAHGNFNKYRQIKIPMISIHEKDSQILGECRTGVIIEDNADKLTSSISALKHGRCFITNGPQFLIKAIADVNHGMGDCLVANSIKIKIEFLSTEEIGNRGTIKVYSGIINEDDEQLISEINISKNIFTEHIEISINKYMYVRAEFEGNSYRGKRIALTNPIWINPTK